MENLSISLIDVSKTYKLYDKPEDRLKEAVNPFRKKYHKDFYALSNISFNIKKGEAVGIIGRNGAGKSTLLKIITGVLTPSNGIVNINGKVSALLELGAGFNPEYTGMENVYLQGTILGYTKQEMDNKIESIIRFADIGDFIYQPVKSYSSGMFARLAFSVAINVEPDILIVDEALSVGDIYFQAKCIAKMKELSKKSTILFVSHSMDMVKSFCTRAILIDSGIILEEGNVKNVAQTYENIINQQIADIGRVQSLEKLSNVNVTKINNYTEETEEDPKFMKLANEFRSGTGEAKFIRVDLFVDGKLSNIVPFGSSVTIRILVKYNIDVISEGTIGYMIRNENGVDVFGMNIYNEGKLLPKMKAGQLLEAKFTFKNILATNGKFTVSIGLKPKPFEPLYFDSVSVAKVFEVPTLENNYVPGLLFVDNEFELQVID